MALDGAGAMNAAQADNNHQHQQQSSASKNTWPRARWVCALLLGFIALILLLILITLDHNHSSNRLTSSASQNDVFEMAASTVAVSNQRRKQRNRVMTSPSSPSDPSNNDDLDNQSLGSDAIAPKVHMRDQEAVCMTPGCVKAAAQLLNNIDNKTQPCDDFYQFACGRWIQTQMIPDEKSSLSIFSQNTADLNMKLRSLIEQKASSTDPPIVNQMRNMYRSCMNVTGIEARGEEPLAEVLRDLGGWPVVTGSVNSINSTSSTRSLSAGGQLQANRKLVFKRSRASDNNNNNNSNFRRRLKRDTSEDEGEYEDRPINSQGRRRGSSWLRSKFKFASDDSDADDQQDEFDTNDANNGNNEDKSTPSTQPRQSDALINDVSQSSWLDIVIKFRQRGFSHDVMIDLSVVPDVRNSRKYVIELDQSTLGLPDRSYYFKGLNDTTVSAYYWLMVDSAVMLGADKAEAERQMSEVLEFETSLAKISLPREQRRNITRLYNKMLARDLYKLAPGIEWDRFLRSLLKDERLDMDTDQVIVKVPSFLQDLDKLLGRTDQQVVINYLIWRVVRHSMSGLSRRWRELAHKYNTVITGRQIEEPRWEQCLGSLDGTLGTALSALYVKHHFNERAKSTALEMVDYIRSEFLKILDEIDWMDDATRQEARVKARAISAYIGYPDELLNDSLIEQLYDGLQLTADNFYDNVRRLRVWSTDYAFGQLRKPNKRGDWKKHARAAVVNAYYNALENSIEFPAGILQGAFFDADRPQYMNFGAIGYVIGHEITHGFDDRGRQFDSQGTDRNWWKPKTDARFKERAQCIVEQYGNYSLGPESNNLRVNGINTQGENIADNGGIKEAFRAYRRWTKDNGREQRLPGLEYSPDQLFWISAASIWCGKFRPEVLRLRVNSGVHSPARFRIIGPLSNSAEFAQSFNCAPGSAMNPHQKCSVW